MLAEIEIGQIFEHRYELLGVLGTGGQSTVFKAHQLDFDRTIALKIIRYSGFDNEDEKQRFLREASILSTLSHKNIVTIYHIGFSGDIPYLAMELVAGESISNRLDQQGAMAPDIAFTIIDQAAAALEEVHAAGVIHRDIKPGNIILVEKPEPNTVKIIDFGLAKSDHRDEKLTQTGTLIGSAHYMSPEQCRADKVDSRTDIYSLGICLLEMISGERPYDADNAMGVMYLHINSPVPQIPEKTQLDQHLNKFFAKALAKNPDDRFQTLSEFRNSLAEVDPFKKTPLLTTAKKRGLVSPPLLFIYSFIFGATALIAATQFLNIQREHQERRSHFEQTNQQAQVRNAANKAVNRKPSVYEPKWIKLNSWEAGTWKCTKQKTLELYDLKTKEPIKSKNERVIPGPWVLGHQRDSDGNIWHLEGMEDSERKGKNYRMERVSRVELEKPIRTEKMVRKHFQAVDQVVIINGTNEWRNPAVVSYDSLLEIAPSGSNKLKVDDRTIVNSEEVTATFRRTEVTWERVKPFEPIAMKDGIDLKKSLAAFLAKQQTNLKRESSESEH